VQVKSILTGALPISSSRSPPGRQKPIHRSVKSFSKNQPPEIALNQPMINPLKGSFHLYPQLCLRETTTKITQIEEEVKSSPFKQAAPSNLVTSDDL
jgi:hypothetical protein